jgi:PQQ-dependent catabolism-associated CXXCW motif protein
MRRICRIALAVIALAGADAIADDGEDADFGIGPTRELRLEEHAAPTPRELPGARTLRTPQLKAWLARDVELQPLLFDVLGGTGHDTIPGAIWLPGAGRGSSFADSVQTRLARTLDALTGGDRARPVVFFCTGVQCWLSYNAALRATELGYRQVYWYRGGLEAWAEAGGMLAPARYRWVSPADGR